MAFSTAQSLQQLGVPTVLAKELGAQIDAGSYNWKRLMWAGMPPTLAFYLGESLASGNFDVRKAAGLGMIPAVATLIAGGGVPSSGLLDIAGSELVANGDFASGITGWTDASSAGGAISHSAGRLITTNTSGTARARTTVATEIGKRYRFMVRGFGVAGVIALGTAAGGAQYFTKSPNAALAMIGIFEFVATSTVAHIQLATFSAGASQWDFVTVRELVETSFPSGTVFSDNFERADGPIGVTPNSLPWRYIDPILSSNVFSAIQSGILTAPDSGQGSTACYNVLTLGRSVKAIHCDISFLGTAGAVAMIGMQPPNPKAPTVSNITTNSLHIVFNDTKVDIGMFLAGEDIIETVTYAAPCATDGTVYPGVGWTIVGNTLTITLPDGSIIQRTDARFAQVNGQVAIVEHYWFSGFGPSRMNSVAIQMA